VFIVWHLTAAAVASLPPALPVVRTAGSQASGPAAFRTLAAAFDTAGGLVSRAAGIAQRASSRFLGKPVDAYLTLTGQGQRWAMFSNVPPFDRYWRVRYYVQPAGGPPWTATELIGPAHPEDRIRLIRSFRDSFQDKALELATLGFNRNRRPEAIRPDAQPSDLPGDLAPIARFFAHRFASARLRGPDERIARTEVWIGSVDNTPPGQPPDETALITRRAVLGAYEGGPVEDHTRVRTYPPYHGVEEEAGIKWVLEYFEGA